MFELLRILKCTKQSYWLCEFSSHYQRNN